MSLGSEYWGGAKAFGDATSVPTPDLEISQCVNALKRGAPLSFNHAALSSCCTFGQGSGWNVLNGFLSFSVILSSSALRTDGR